MKNLISIILILLSIVSYAQEDREYREKHNETIDDAYLPRDNNSIRTKRVIHNIESTSSSASVIVTTQVNIDSAGNNITLDAGNEPSIAISPVNSDIIVIGWRQFDNVFSNFRQAGFSYSSDGGITWAPGDVIQRGIFRSDPVLDCDSAGNFYYNSLTRDSLQNFLCHVFKSTNGGATWDSGTFANGGDKQWMVIDKSGVGESNIYSAWSSDYSSCPVNNFTRSINAGANYDPCSFILSMPRYLTMDIDDAGSLYIGGMCPYNLANQDSIVVAKCSDPTAGGPQLTWDSKFVYMDGLTFTNATVNPAGLIGQMNIAVDHSSAGLGNIYLVASMNRISVTDMADVMFCKSSDGGLTWHIPIRINDDPSLNAQQWLATLSVAPNGRIDIVWLDTRDNPSSDISALYYSYSYDQGTTWSTNEKLSQNFDPHIGYPAQNKMGDYFDMISDDVSARLAWCNTLNGEQDVYYSIITPPLPTAIAESTNPPLTIYPNPAKHNIKINSLAIIASIEIYTVEGARLLMKQISDRSTDLNLAVLSSGIYFLNIQFHNGMHCVKKLIVEN